MCKAIPSHFAPRLLAFFVLCKIASPFPGYLEILVIRGPMKRSEDFISCELSQTIGPSFREHMESEIPRSISGCIQDYEPSIYLMTHLQSLLWLLLNKRVNPALEIDLKTPDHIGLMYALSFMPYTERVPYPLSLSLDPPSLTSNTLQRDGGGAGVSGHPFSHMLTADVAGFTSK